MPPTKQVELSEHVVRAIIQAECTDLVSEFAGQIKALHERCNMAVRNQQYMFARVSVIEALLLQNKLAEKEPLEAAIKLELGKIKAEFLAIAKKQMVEQGGPDGLAPHKDDAHPGEGSQGARAEAPEAPRGEGKDDAAAPPAPVAGEGHA